MALDFQCLLWKFFPHTVGSYTVSAGMCNIPQFLTQEHVYVSSLLLQSCKVCLLYFPYIGRSKCFFWFPVGRESWKTGISLWWWCERLSTAFKSLPYYYISTITLASLWCSSTRAEGALLWSTTHKSAKPCFYLDFSFSNLLTCNGDMCNHCYLFECYKFVVCNMSLRNFCLQLCKRSVRGVPQKSHASHGDKIYMPALSRGLYPLGIASFARNWTLHDSLILILKVIESVQRQFPETIEYTYLCINSTEV